MTSMVAALPSDLVGVLLGFDLFAGNRTVDVLTTCNRVDSGG